MSRIIGCEREAFAFIMVSDAEAARLGYEIDAELVEFKRNIRSLGRRELRDALDAGLRQTVFGFLIAVEGYRRDGWRCWDLGGKVVRGKKVGEK